MRAARGGAAAGHTRIGRVRGPADRGSAGAVAPGRSARLQRYQGDPGAARRTPRSSNDRDHAPSRSRRRCVARLCQGRAPAQDRRPHRLRRGFRRRCRREASRGRRDFALRSGSERRSARRSRATARCRCRPISNARAAAMRATASIIRRSSPAPRVPWRRRRRVSISPDALLDALAERGIGWTTLTLHVGPGTFLPVKTADPRDHKMHAEWGVLSAETAERIAATRRDGGRIVAVGTTSLRLLESAAAENGEVRPFAGETRLFILPGYRFRAIDLLLTNFHLPRSTLLMLVAAFAGLDRIKSAYAHAIAVRLSLLFVWRCLLDRAAKTGIEPIPDLPGPALERGGSTRSGRSLPSIAVPASAPRRPFGCHRVSRRRVAFDHCALLWLGCPLH